MTKGELRKARREARSNGVPLTGELAIRGHNEGPKPKPVRRYQGKPRNASKAEQYARYLDCGPGNWDDR